MRPACVDAAVEDGHDWPEPRPALWRVLAALDWQLQVTATFSGSADAILLYHSVGGVSGADYRWDLPTAIFREQLRVLAARFKIVDLVEIAENPGADRKRVAITFDDGFASVADAALPVLREFDAPATVFLSPAFLDWERSSLFCRRHNLPDMAADAALSTEAAAKLASDPLITIGNHTETHPNLGDLSSRSMIEAEVRAGKRGLEERLGVSVERFSYPYGVVDERARCVVADLHDLAVTSQPALVGPSADPYALSRLDGCQPTSTLCFEVTDAADRLRRIVRRIQRATG